MKLLQVVGVIDAKLIGADQAFESVSIDSRHFNPGQLFIAIVGEQFDGHDFIDEITQKGACAAIVSQDRPANIPLLKVADTKSAMAKLACFHRAQMNATTFGITGSCGKTTTKMMLASIVSQHANTLFSEKSFNNDIGVPLTLLRLKSEHRYAVFEIGANHPGEIAMLSNWVKPDVAVVLNAACVHLEGFKTVQGVAQEKGTIFDGLSEQGTAIINKDDAFCDYWCGLVANKRIITFGIHHQADVMATHIRTNVQIKPCFQLRTPEGEVEIVLSVIGEHNVMNALAAAAMANAAGLSMDDIKRGLEATQGVARRMIRTTGLHGVTVLDDTYNANPLSFVVAMEVLKQHSGKSVMVMGDMMELGKDAEKIHRELGEKAQQLGIEHLYCYGELARFSAQAFGKQGQYFSKQDDLIAVLKNELQQDMTVLVKGSKSMKMNNITKAITGDT